MTDSLTWFRLHADTIDDPKLKLMAFEDRWHFVAILCCKAQGIQDKYEPKLARRMVAAKLGLNDTELEQVIERLAEMNLVNAETLQPIAWKKRQYKSDLSTERVKRHRKKQKEQQDNNVKRFGNVSETPPETDTETDTETEKEEKKKNKQKKKTEKFVPPTVEEVRAYCRSRRNSVDPEMFVAFYESKGWLVGKTKMKNWKASVLTWERSQQQKQPLADPADRRLN